MSNDDLLNLLRTITDNTKNTLALYEEVHKVEKELLQDLIKAYEQMTEQEKIITALVIEVKNLQERVSKLEKREKGN